MNCPTCGTNLPENGGFCPNCGTRVECFANLNPNPVPPVMPNGYGVQKRNIALCIVFSIITCGIYAYYWLYTMTGDTNCLAGKTNGTSGGVVILLSIITCGIYLWYWMYKRGNLLDRVKANRGMPAGNSGILYLILAIIGLSIISYALIQNDINNLAG